MLIEWFPGHMSKAKREIAETIATVDLVIEVLDARLPVSSSNPLLEELRGKKPCIKALNKHDLADQYVTKKWLRYFEQQDGVKALPLDAKKHAEAGQLVKLCQRLLPHRGVPGRSLRVMIVGIPNVGKSTLINTLAGKRIANVGDRPAVTTCRQKIQLAGNIVLSDTPGLLWPVLSNQNGAYRLAASGAIGDNAFDYVEVAIFTVDFLLKRYPEMLQKIYPFATAQENPTTILEQIGRRHGCLVGGGEVDLSRASEFLIRALRAGKLGRISFEMPGEDLVEPVDTEAGPVEAG
jgi:ribosome biogenesis GTPase A